MLNFFGKRRYRDCDGTTRREFLKIGTLGAGALTLPGLLAARAQAKAAGRPVKNTSVVWLWLAGGPTHIETFNPRMTAPSEYRSTTGEVRTPMPGVTLGGTFPQIARVGDKMAFVRSFAHTNSGHVGGTHWVMTGYDNRMIDNGGLSTRPAIGSIVARVRGANDPHTGMPNYVRLGAPFRNGTDGPAFLGTGCAPFDPAGQALKNMSPNIAEDRMGDRRALLTSLDRINSVVDRSGMMDGIDRFEEQAFNLMLGQAPAAFDLKQEKPKLVARYGKGLGEQLLRARRLCEAGCGFVAMSYGGWDMHRDIKANLKKRSPEIDNAVATFVEDVHQRGLSDNILLVITGEFGRTPKVNKTGGRDHWAPLSTLALSGGGLKMGQVVGDSAPKADVPKTKPIRPQDLMATVFQVLGIDSQTQFINNAGRPVYMLEDGHAIAELVYTPRDTLAQARSPASRATIRREPADGIVPGAFSVLSKPIAVMLAGACVWCGAVSPLRGETNWPGWGGPQGNSHSEETGLPLTLANDQVLWKVPLKGVGQSTPVVWKNQIFLTTALEHGKQRVVLGLDRRNGRVLWEHVAWTGEPEESHVMNGWASATCATNGQVVVAFFGRGGLHGYTLDGQPLWSRDLGQFDGPWGTAASPIFYGDTVIQNCDSESPEASLLAVDYRTGKTVWQTPRECVRGWSTPMLIRTDSREELILNSQSGVRSYDPASGRELWWCQGFNGRGEPVPAYARGLLYVVNGLAGDIYSVRPGGSGDATATHRVWHTPRKAGRDLPSPVAIDKYLLVMSMAGILTCYDCTDGKELWKERLGEKYSSSPLVAEGRAYFTSEGGETIVIEPGEKLKVAAKSQLGSEDREELFRSALVPSVGQFLVRSTKNLYCVGPQTVK